MKSTWRPINDQTFRVKTIIEYSDSDILFNSNDIITLNESFQKISNLVSAAQTFADDNNLTFSTDIKMDEKSITFCPFFIKKTIVFVERLKNHIMLYSPFLGKPLIDNIKYVKDITMLNLNNFTTFKNLPYWDNDNIFKFCFVSRLIVDQNQKVARLKFTCTQVSFENKQIRRKYNEIMTEYDNKQTN